MLESIPELGLSAGDRLEACPRLPDVGTFDMIDQFPVHVLFWKVSAHNICVRTCPLSDPEIGITPEDSIALDLLHTFNLGPAHAYAKHVFWETPDC